MPSTPTQSRDNAGHVQGALRDMLLNYQKVVTDLETLRQALTLDVVTQATALSRGSTDTNLANTAFAFSITGVQVTKAAVAAGTAFGALGTIPASKWGIIAADVIANGTVSFLSGAANYTTGYATEAAAIAALPARVTGKARMGYVTILATASTFVVGTDALQGGASGNPATTTNYYPQAGLLAPTGGLSVAGGANGVLIPTVLSRGSTDTNLANTAFTYNANGLTNLAKAAVAAGTAFGALGTVPASKWAIIVPYIDSAGVITYQSGPMNYGSGYGTETAAIGDLGLVTVPAGKCRMGYVTIQASASTFVVGTDALAGGASGNPATTTNYYPQAGITLAAGLTAAQIGDLTGAVFTT